MSGDFARDLKWFMDLDSLRSLSILKSLVFDRRTCVVCFDGIRVMGFGSPGVCSMTVFKCVVFIVIFARPVVGIARDMNAAYTLFPSVRPLRTNADVHASTCARELGLSVCGPSNFFDSSCLL